MKETRDIIHVHMQFTRAQYKDIDRLKRLYKLNWEKFFIGLIEAHKLTTKHTAHASECLD